MMVVMMTRWIARITSRWWYQSPEMMRGWFGCELSVQSWHKLCITVPCSLFVFLQKSTWYPAWKGCLAWIWMKPSKKPKSTLSFPRNQCNGLSLKKLMFVWWPFRCFVQLIMKHRHRRNVTIHHFASFLFTSFHFCVYSNFFGSYQLKGKYNKYGSVSAGR